MKKRNLAIALSVIAVAAFAEYRIIVQQPKQDDISISVSSQDFRESVNAYDDAIIVDIKDVSSLRHEYNGISASVTNYRSVAEELLLNLDTIEKLNEFSVKCNIDISAEEDGVTFYKTVDRNYSSTADVNNYLSMNLTESLIADRYGNITGGNNPVLKDVNGDLYVRKNDEKGDGFNWDKDESGNIILEISETNSEKFTVHSSGHIITIVNDNSLWKVDSIN